MASAPPIQIIDEDDDGFDWEAAVREIDSACVSASSRPSTSSAVQNSGPTVGGNGANAVPESIKAGNSRQSTLDKFVSRKYPPRAAPDVDMDRGEFSERDDRVCDVSIDEEAAKTWIYPVNVPLRDYQFSITKTALFSNTLVALPTGLGKTLIAAVVMYNYFRWFPEGKIVFAAPSRPLVMQQIEACHNVVGIPQEWTIDMTGQTSPLKRAGHWKEKRVFFVTPQVLEKDIKSGTCMMKYLVCLVIDEAHRAMGNYAYCVAVRELLAASVQLRILALSATPGSKQQTIQQIIDNLQLSTLEYRNESDHDVSPYVHNRKIELMEVAMGKDAVDISDLLLDVIRPYVARLCALRVLQTRDATTLNPCDLLNWRGKFRDAPPPDIPQSNYREVEGYFSILITLYHIRKLLSSHGIRPAYDMLEEKLQQGSFVRLMGRNETMHRVKLLMQRSLSHGAQTPKLAKLLQVLSEHFNTRDPQNSRVIIFSNFRGSVRDIICTLATIGEHVKATEFIGQSSGKTLKGQTQKIQQAVLEKFRAGGYNVIVATSIGEEGLDIMEVDLVICFDANISPLRMIQRMGRTGRKNDGRVVVLACEGSEVKGYRRKLGNSNAMRKHLHNGGVSSFNFHNSSRMVPHRIKPEVRYVELSFEKFVHRGKKVKDDPSIYSPKPIEKLRESEAQLIAKYFPSGGECTWKPSLIAFPSFQSVPSRVHEVKHSFRTSTMIEAMQQLQEISYTGYSEIVSHANKGSPVRSSGSKFVSVDHDDVLFPENFTKPQNGGDVYGLQALPAQEDDQDSHGYELQPYPVHHHLFGSEFVSVDPLGGITIMSVPVLPYEGLSKARNMISANTSPQQFRDISIRPGDINTLTLQPDYIEPPQIDKIANHLPDLKDLHSDTLKLNDSRSTDDDYDGEAPDNLAHKASILEDSETEGGPRDSQLSPRLTNFLLSGVVPESPIDDCGINSIGESYSLAPKLLSSTKLFSETPSSKRCEVTSEVNVDTNGKLASSMEEETHTTRACLRSRGRVFASPSTSGELHAPLMDQTSNELSTELHLNLGDKMETVEKPRKLKRLRRHRDCLINNNNKKKKSVVDTNLSVSSIKILPLAGTTNEVDDVRDFIEEEAEVSSQSGVSADEEEGSSSYDDSFIDDKTSFSGASMQAEADKIDMMAIYRRSLLSQSPLVRQPVYSNFSDPDSVAQMTNTTGKGNTSRKTTGSNTIELVEHDTNSTTTKVVSNQQRSEKLFSMKNPCPCSSSLSPEKIPVTGSRKRKYQAYAIPPVNLEKQFFAQSNAEDRESCQVVQEADKTAPNPDIFGDDDDFYEGLDLDAVEAEATLFFKSKSDPPTQLPDSDSPSSPTFDLGI